MQWPQLIHQFLSPKAQGLVDALAVRGGEPLYKLSHADARNALAVLAIGTTDGSDTYQHRSRKIRGVIMEAQGDIALIGLAVMGQNLILNMDDHGFTVVAYNRTVSKVDEFLAREARGTKVIGAHSIQEMVARLTRPRRVMLMVRAGTPVDEFIERLMPHLEPGDIIIDGGNSRFEDTNRRAKHVESKGLLYIGTSE